MITLFVIVFFLQILLVNFSVNAAERPNIVFILTDDQASWTLRGLGNTQAQTPNLDRLFSQSATLQNCFVSTPVCSPSRASLLTSRYGSEVGITDWINVKVEPEVGLGQEFVTWPEHLQHHGYQTSLFGKWHLGIQPDQVPEKHGFNTFMGFLPGGVTVMNPEMMVNGAPRKFEGYTDEILTDSAVDYLKKYNSPAPFLLCLHLRAPHAPWTPFRDEDRATYVGMEPIIPNPSFPDLDVQKVKDKTVDYLTAVTSVDRNVGRVMEALEQRGLCDSTILIFTSDNGYNIGHNGIWHKGNGHRITLAASRMDANDPNLQRPNMYDNSLRAPAAIRWPGKIAAGSKVSQTVAGVDWFPTLLAMANIPQPTDALIHGHNFLPLLEGQSIEWNNDMYGEYSQHHYATTGLRIYRTTEWKLIRDYVNPGKDELYHLSVDPSEATNLIGDPALASVCEELQGKLDASMKALVPFKGR